MRRDAVRPPAGGRRLGGWGFAGEALAPSPALLGWLAERFAAGPPVPAFEPRSALRLPPPRPLPGLAGLSAEPLDRLAHARGQGLSDLVRLRTGTVAAAPDAVARAASGGEIADLLAACSRAGVLVVPWGGGTSVTGALDLLPGGPPAVALDLERCAGLAALDEVSGLATFGAGTRGPALEAALAARGFTLGHFPQSFELSTLGGWIATRASGQESLGYGRIEDLVAGLSAVAPAGPLEIPARPAAAVGPDARELVLGSEGRLAVILRATVRVRRAPESREVRAWLLPDWPAGLAAARAAATSGLPLGLLRLSDEPETEVAMAVGLGGRRFSRTALSAWLRLRRRDGWGCLLLAGATGSPARVAHALEAADDLLGEHRAVALGGSPGRHWLRDRFRHPYLRDGLLDRGIATDTFETACPWSGLPALYGAVRAAVEAPLLCHLSHAYPDGASLYFTMFIPCAGGPDETIGRWAALKRRATEAVLAGGGVLSHHHGVGAWHAPWYERAVGTAARAAVAAAARALDPAGVLGPRVLLDPTDRLEV
jgi:alkyldihydroxyacetonephosphate synthase